MVTQISADELEALLSREDREDVLLIDVRTRPEYEISHIPDSINVPLSKFTSDIADLDIPSNVVVLCEVGAASEQAARLLEAYEGVDSETTVAHLVGGIRDWEGPLETMDRQTC